METIGKAGFGSVGTPGDLFRDGVAEVRRSPGGRYELSLLLRWGSNQGYLEEHGRVERRYRARTLDDLLRVAQTELREDGAIDDRDRPEVLQAVRDAIFDAEDAEA